MEHILGENRKLRKEIKQLRRMVEKNPAGQDEPEVESSSEDTYLPQVIKCDDADGCGKGVMVLFEIRDMKFGTCNVCGHRRKLK